MPVNDAEPSPEPSRFSPTRWTLVVRARGETAEAKLALAELCETYYQPVLWFLRGEGRDEDSARELTQEFFARILTRGGFESVDRERGRFRSYLLGTLKHFLSDQRKHERRLKRGGGVFKESLDVSGSEADGESIQVADPWAEVPDSTFDRQWAVAIMAQGLGDVQQEFDRAGKGEQFELLKPWLEGEVPSLSQADAARRLGMSEGAVKVVIHRLRKRFREAVRARIAQTLSDPSLVDDELRHLIEALV